MGMARIARSARMAACISRISLGLLRTQAPIMPSCKPLIQAPTMARLLLVQPARPMEPWRRVLTALERTSNASVAFGKSLGAVTEFLFIQQHTEKLPLSVRFSSNSGVSPIKSLVDLTVHRDTPICLFLIQAPQIHMEGHSQQVVLLRLFGKFMLVFNTPDKTRYFPIRCFANSPTDQ